MARYDFGGTLADFVISTRRLGGIDVLGLASATLTFWSAQSGGTRYTDLQLNGSATSSISVGTDGQVPTFQGPDAVTAMWADGGAGRTRIVAQGIPGPSGPGATNSDIAGYLGTPGATQTAADARYVGKGTQVFYVNDEGAVGNGTADSTTAIQSAINKAAAVGGGIVQLGSGTYRTSATLALKSGVTLRGAGRLATSIRLLAGANCHVVALADARQEQIAVRDLTIDGNRFSNTGTWHGIFIANDTATSGPFTTSGLLNPHHFFHNLLIRYCTGDGLFLSGDAFGGEVHSSHLFAYSNDRFGFNTATPDSFWSFCSSAQSGSAGFNIQPGAANSRFYGCKSWFSGRIVTTGPGYAISGARHTIVGCEAQDNAGHGFELNTVRDSSVQGFSADSNGTVANGTKAGILLNGVTSTMVTGASYDRQTTTVQGYGISFNGANSGNDIAIVLGTIATTAVLGTVGDNHFRYRRSTAPFSKFSVAATLEISAGGIQAPVSFTNGTAYAATASDSVILNNTTGATVTLPAASTALRGRQYHIRNSVASSMTVNTAGGNIDATTSVTLAANVASRYVCDGTGWWTF